MLYIKCMKLIWKNTSTGHRIQRRGDLTSSLGMKEGSLTECWTQGGRDRTFQAWRIGARS